MSTRMLVTECFDGNHAECRGYNGPADSPNFRCDCHCHGRDVMTNEKDNALQQAVTSLVKDGGGLAPERLVKRVCKDGFIDCGAHPKSEAREVEYIRADLATPASAAPVVDTEKQARGLVDAFRFASPSVQSLRVLKWEPLVTAIADALRTAALMEQSDWKGPDPRHWQAVPEKEVLCACRTFILDDFNGARAYLDGCDFVHTVNGCPSKPVTDDNEEAR